MACDPPPIQEEPVSPNKLFPLVWIRWFTDICNRITKLEEAEVSQKTAFGELLTADLTPQVQLQFPYNINSAQSTSFPGNGGTVSNGNDHANVATGTASDGFGILFSRDVLKYNAGQGSLCRFTALFTTGVADSEQIIGCGNTLNGFFFGYNGADFGVLRRSGGSSEMRTLTITTASTTAENVTVTLDGVAVSVPVTNSGDASVTALEIASFNYTSIGTGWGARSAGNIVTFISVRPEDMPGSYSLTASTAVGAFAQVAEGGPPVDDWTAQEDWNIDKMDGRGASRMTLDQTKGNVYQVRFQWLGYGQISFAIEDAQTGDIIEVHRVKYANANTTPSLSNPTFPMFMSATNQGNTSDLVIKSSSMSAFVEGKEAKIGPKRSADNLFTIGAVTTEEPVLTIINKQIYQGDLNLVRIEPTYLILSSNLAANNSNTVFRTYINAVPINGVSYTDISTNSSVIQFDVLATDFDSSNAELENTFILDKVQSITIPLAELADKLAPGQTFMITAQPSKSNAANEVGATLNWKELF